MTVDQRVQNLRCVIIDNSSLNVSLIRQGLDELGIRSVVQVMAVINGLEFLDESPVDILIANPGTCDKQTGLSILELMTPAQRDRFSVLLICDDHSRASLLTVMNWQPDEMLLIPCSMSELQARVLRVCNKHFAIQTARSALVEGAHGRALELCQDLMKQDGPVGQWGAQKLIQLHQQNNDHHQVEQLSRSLLNEQGMEWMHAALVDALCHQNRHADALLEAEVYAQRFTHHARPYRLLGDIHRNLNDHHQALTTLERARHLDPSCIHTTEACGDVSVELGEFEKAERAYKRTLVLVRNGFHESPDIYLKLADAIKKKTEQIDNEKARLSQWETAHRVLGSGGKRFPQDEAIQVNQCVLGARIAIARSFKDRAEKLINLVVDNYNHCLDSSLDMAEEVAASLHDLGDKARAEELEERIERNREIQQLQAAQVQEPLSDAQFMDTIVTLRQQLVSYPTSPALNMDLVQAAVGYMHRYRTEARLLDECGVALRRAGAHVDVHQDRDRLAQLHEWVDMLTALPDHVRPQDHGVPNTVLNGLNVLHAA